MTTGFFTTGFFTAGFLVGATVFVTVGFGVVVRVVVRVLGGVDTAGLGVVVTRGVVVVFGVVVVVLDAGAGSGDGVGDAASAVPALTAARTVPHATTTRCSCSLTLLDSPMLTPPTLP